MQQKSYGFESIFWCDVETTGTEASDQYLLQVAGLVTTPELEPVEDTEFNHYVYYTAENVETLKNHTIPYVKEMHEKTGLWEQLPVAGIPIDVLDTKIFTTLSNLYKPNDLWLGGNSIFLDRSFLNLNLPQTAGFIHYRSVDVTSVAGLGYMWYGEKFEKKQTHNALDDIRESIEELKFFRSRIFK